MLSNLGGLGGKSFYEREGNLSCALLILVSLSAFQSHSKPLQLNKWKHQALQCVVWQISQSKVTFRETPAFSKEKRPLNSNVSGKELPFFEMLTLSVVSDTGVSLYFPPWSTVPCVGYCPWLPVGRASVVGKLGERFLGEQA